MPPIKVVKDLIGTKKSVGAYVYQPLRGSRRAPKKAIVEILKCAKMAK